MVLIDDKYWDIKTGFSVNFEVGYIIKFNKVFGIGFGLGTSSYKVELSGSSAFDTVAVYDQISGDYSKAIRTSDMSEKTLINYFDIPVFVEFGNTNIDKIGYYGRVGLRFSIPFSNATTAGGFVNYDKFTENCWVDSISSDGWRWAWDSPIYNNPEAGIRPINVSAIISAGVTFPISNSLIFKAGANANIGLTEISKYKADNYNNTKYDGNYNKTLENPNSKTYTRSFGFEIGLIYGLRFY